MKIFKFVLFSLMLVSVCLQSIFSQTIRELPTSQNSKSTKQSGEINLGNFLYITAEDIKTFIGNLNDAGKRGYKLQHITKHPLNGYEGFDRMMLAGVVKLNAGNTYEYDWFESFTPGETVTRMNLRAKNGFYYLDNLAVSQGICESVGSYSPEKSDTEKIYEKVLESLTFGYGNIFFLERKNAVIQTNEYRVVTGNLGWGKKPTDELENELKNAVETGFRPVAMGSNKALDNYAFTILIERNSEIQKESDDLERMEFKFLKSEFNFQKKINRLAEKGYGVKFNGEFGALNYALMTKESESKTSAYKWIDATDNDFDKKISKYFSQNLIYRKIGNKSLRCDSVEGEMLFEQIDPAKGKKYEYKILTLNEQSKVLNKNELPVRFELPSDKKIEEFRKIMNEGYVIRDLFYSNGVKVLFERQ